MTPFESLLLAAGAVLLSLFAARTGAPFLRTRLAATADRRATDLRAEFLAVSPRRILAGLAAAGAVFAAFAWAFSGSAAWAVPAAGAPALLSGFAVRAYRTRRRQSVVLALPGFLDLIAGHLKAGHSLQEAVLGAMPLLSGPIRQEIAWLSQLVRLGTPLHEAFLQWERRMPCEEISLVARPLRVAIPLGGNVAELLLRLRNVLQARTRTAEKMRSMTAQARLQAVVLTFLPPAFVAVLSQVDRAFLPNLLGSAAGKAMLAAAGVLQLLGWLFIRKILSVRP